MHSCLKITSQYFQKRKTPENMEACFCHISPPPVFWQLKLQHSSKLTKTCFFCQVGKFKLWFWIITLKFKWSNMKFWITDGKLFSFFSLSGRKFQLTVATFNVILHQEIHVSFLFETETLLVPSQFCSLAVSELLA